jgi:hypothetical protein
VISNSRPSFSAASARRIAVEREEIEGAGAADGFARAIEAQIEVEPADAALGIARRRRGEIERSALDLERIAIARLAIPAAAPIGKRRKPRFAALAGIGEQHEVAAAEGNQAAAGEALPAVALRLVLGEIGADQKFAAATVLVLMRRPERGDLVEPLEPVSVALDHELAHEHVPRDRHALEAAFQLRLEGPERRILAEQGNLDIADDGLRIFEVGQRADLLVDSLRAAIIGRDREMVGCHQLLDRLDVLLLEGPIERLGGLVDLGDGLCVGGSCLDQAGCGKDEEQEQGYPASHATSWTEHEHRAAQVTVSRS